MPTSLYERLGGAEGIFRIASDTVDLHMKNPLIAPRFQRSDLKTVKTTVADFFITGSGGPPVYKGKDMVSTHRGMNISDNEFMAAVDDVMAALTSSNIGDQEKAEVLYIFYNLRPQVVRM
jgi:hemoglobin